MTWSTALPWTAALGAVLVLVALVLRYAALQREETPLPPGVGGARMVGTTGAVTAPHDPPGQRGVVHVLGDDWHVADEVTEPLAVGDEVVVERVAGTRLVVRRSPPRADGPPRDADQDRS